MMTIIFLGEVYRSIGHLVPTIVNRRCACRKGLVRRGLVEWRTTMDSTPATILRRAFGAEGGPGGRVLARWLFLRALGLIYFSAFFSLVFQIRGLIGPRGILPAGEYLNAVAERFGHTAYWYAPTLLWFSQSSRFLLLLCWAGMIAALLLTLNLWPRGMLAVCFVCFLSFVGAAQDFSGHQSDGMLLEAGFIAWFFAPPGLRPGLAADHRSSWASLFLLQWECFRIYFESGVAKIAGGDPQWRNFTALDEYYQNGPLPTWIGWYVQHFPHGFHATMTFLTLALELGLVWFMFFPRRFRIGIFCFLTTWQIGVILTANYTFLNYLTLALGFSILDDGFLGRFFPKGFRRSSGGSEHEQPCQGGAQAAPLQSEAVETPEEATWWKALLAQVSYLRLAVASVVLTWIFYATLAEMAWMLRPGLPLPTGPVVALEPLRIANRYGLFGIMTRGRYEIELQGSRDGQTWLAYSFRFKPQDTAKPPGIYAPYQPRFDWNLWFASLSSWREEPMVWKTERELLAANQDVLALFDQNPFPDRAPKQVRAIVWQYWFTSPAEKRATGMWWRRKLIGLYAPTLEREDDGTIVVVQWPVPSQPME